MSDLIKRSDAIRAIDDKINGSDNRLWLKEIISELPSEEPDKDLIHLQKEQAYMQGYEDGKKSRRGKWIIATGMMPPEFHGHHCCSKCGNFANMEPPFGNREDLSKFCPNCGADMRGENDEIR